MRSGIRKLIYVKSQDLWDEIVESAKKDDRSVSSYLINCHRRCREIDEGRKGDVEQAVRYEEWMKRNVPEVYDEEDALDMGMEEKPIQTITHPVGNGVNLPPVETTPDEDGATHFKPNPKGEPKKKRPK